jgi:cholesterol transport system auxiliary component
VKRLTATLVFVLATACSGLLPKPVARPAYHSLDRAAETAVATRAVLPLLATAPTLIVNAVHAAAGSDSRRMMYLRQAHKLEYFAQHEWLDTPARMLAPLIIAALESSGGFRAVVLTPSAAAGDMTLDTGIVRLHQDFTHQPSMVRFTLHVSMVDNTTRNVVGWREFDASVAATRDDPEGGVVAANLAVQAVLEQLTGFCVDIAARWQPVPRSNVTTLR